MPPPQPVKISQGKHDVGNSGERAQNQQKSIPTTACTPNDTCSEPQDPTGSPSKVNESPTLTKAQLAVMADLETLSAASKSKEVDEKDPNPSDWKPPEGQSGDGRTHLNAKFGY